MKTHYVLLKSSDRDTTQYPKVNKWSVTSSKRFKDVVDIKLVRIKLPTTTITEDLLYLSLSDTVQLDQLHGASSSLLSGRSLIPVFTNGVIDNQINQDTTFELEFTKTNIYRFDIALLKSDGTLYDFGETNGDLSPHNQVYILLKIITET